MAHVGRKSIRYRRLFARCINGVIHNAFSFFEAWACGASPLQGDNATLPDIYRCHSCYCCVPFRYFFSIVPTRKVAGIFLTLLVKLLSLYCRISSINVSNNGSAIGHIILAETVINSVLQF